MHSSQLYTKDKKCRSNIVQSKLHLLSICPWQILQRNLQMFNKAKKMWYCGSSKFPSKNTTKHMLKLIFFFIFFFLFKNALRSHKQKVITLFETAIRYHVLKNCNQIKMNKVGVMSMFHGANEKHINVIEFGIIPSLLSIIHYLCYYLKNFYC